MNDLSQPHFLKIVKSYTSTTTCPYGYVIDANGAIVEVPIKDMAIDEIKGQPYFGGSSE